MEDWERWKAMAEAERLSEPDDVATVGPTDTEQEAIEACYSANPTWGGDEEDRALALAAGLIDRGIAAAPISARDEAGAYRLLLRLPSGAVVAPRPGQQKGLT